MAEDPAAGLIVVRSSYINALEDLSAAIRLMSDASRHHRVRWKASKASPLRPSGCPSMRESERSSGVACRV